MAHGVTSSMLNDNDTSSHPSAKFPRCSRSCSAFADHRSPTGPRCRRHTRSRAWHPRSGSCPLRFLSRRGSAAWVVSLCTRSAAISMTVSVPAGLEHGGTSRGRAVYPGEPSSQREEGMDPPPWYPALGSPPSCPAWAARPWRQLAAWLPLAGCRRAPRRGNIWLHGPTTSGHAQQSSFGGVRIAVAQPFRVAAEVVGLGPEPRLKALLTRATVHRLADRPRRQSAGRNTDPLARRRLGPSRGRRLGVGNPVRRPPGPGRRAHGPDPRADLGASDLFRVGGHLRRKPVWTGNDDERNRSGSVSKLDPKTLKVMARRRLDFGPHGAVATPHAVHVADAHGGRLLEADPATARVRRIAELSPGLITPAVGAGWIWSSSAAAWGGTTQDDRVLASTHGRSGSRRSCSWAATFPRWPSGSGVSGCRWAPSRWSCASQLRARTGPETDPGSEDRPGLVEGGILAEANGVRSVPDDHPRPIAGPHCRRGRRPPPPTPSGGLLLVAAAAQAGHGRSVAGGWAASRSARPRMPSRSLRIIGKSPNSNRTTAAPPPVPNARGTAP